MSVFVDDVLKDLREAELFATDEISKVSDEPSLQVVKSKYLGKKSALKKVSALFREASPDERKVLGGEVNRIRKNLENLLESKKESFGSSSGMDISFDPTLPGKIQWTGHAHPLTLVINEIKSIFSQLGFDAVFGPEVEDDWHNFEALNHPAHHPARDMQDTYYISENILLRTHTSPVQIRLMENQKPPIRAIMPGRVYRNEEISARSYNLFHQLEGLCVDETSSFADIKGLLSHFVKKMFGANVRSKFRPSFFPFTEPSAEMDIECFLCNSKGCPVCKHTGWLEILGCGMVDPNVLKSVNIDSEKYIGYAFGMGIERIAMLKYGINDIRLFYENDKRFLEQF